MAPTQNLSKKLKAYRISRGMTQAEFALEIGISKSTLQEIEHGKSPTLETLSCIASHLNIPAAVLLSDSVPPTQLNVIAQLVQGFDWFAQCSSQEQDQLLRALEQVSHSLSLIKDKKGEGT